MADSQNDVSGVLSFLSLSPSLQLSKTKKHARARARPLTLVIPAVAVCSPPAVCKDIIHPDGSLGQDGKAIVDLQAELGYLSGAGLEPAALSDVLINRFRSTMALKLGVEPQAQRGRMAVEQVDVEALLANELV